MYFKQLELSGFKSFCDRTHVRLEKGITAIVGPNGCGKSNILDSLRWALGEQSARELRGQHMMDIIFNGSENRSATGMAEVSVTFDNADSRLPVDFAEVQVTRRLYRSGESEYFINKAPCRLRDITELFMDTGIGTSAYSLIGQGKIGLVLSSKPEDRRFLFEEAAGIIKYKARKKVAIRKLESAEQNLVRLNDIIMEVQRQMRSLKRQVNAAIRFRELKEALRELEVRAIWLKYTRFRDEMVTLREQLGAAQEEYGKAMAEMADFEARNEELSLTRIEVERDLAARRETVQLLDAEMEKTERQIALLRQQTVFVTEQREQAIRDREAYEARAESLNQEASRTSEQVAALEAETDACRQEMESCQTEHDGARERLAEAEERLGALRRQAVESMNSRAKAQTELETLGVSVQNLETLLAQLTERRSSVELRRDELAERVAAAGEAEAAARAELERVLSEKARITEEQTRKNKELRAKMDEWQSLREKKSSVEARLNSLRELRDSYEGFAVGVRAVMMAKQRKLAEFRGIIGPVGDLLSTQKTYERAIEAALGGNINNIVVEEADAAKSAIQFLKQNRAGRVTFLPLDTIRPNHNDDTNAIRGKPGVIGPAIDYVTYDSHIRKAVEYLLYNTVIVETLDDAIRIARSENRYPRMVTLDGEFVSPAGSVTGGQNQTETRGLLGRSAEIAELEEKVQKMQNDGARLSAAAEVLTKELQAHGQQLRELEEAERTGRHRANECGVLLARATTELETLEESLRHSSSELETRREQLAELVDKREQALLVADSMLQDDETLQRAVEEQQEAMTAARDALTAAAARLADLRVGHAELSQRLEETRRNVAREQSERGEALENAQRRLEQAAALEENQRTLAAEIDTNIDRAKDLAGQKEAAHAKVVEAQNRQHALLDETDGLSKSLRELNEQSRNAQAQVHRLEIQLRHDEDQTQFLEERVLAEYHMGLASIDPDSVGTDELDEETREAQVLELREKLERLGQVNVMAIEEYEALEKRNEFLTTQERDLTKARETLLGIVARIDLIIKEMFLETFAKVSDNFRVFFRRLFNGGQARIYLLDESDPLECGIEIEARPPGKKPQGISLLSGGEQAMTAIALLFSIFRAKPSPFCVLDEVDAPLDDANIGRFLDMVEEFTDQSQFIIITHSKQTMARANVLYGVTMQERGVSQLVSVRFDDARPPRQEEFPEPPPEDDGGNGEGGEEEEEPAA